VSDDHQLIRSHNAETGLLIWYFPTNGELLLSHVEPDFKKAQALGIGIEKALARESAIASARAAANIVLRFHETADAYLEPQTKRADIASALVANPSSEG
jgi:hypothetical protein